MIVQMYILESTQKRGAAFEVFFTSAEIFLHEIWCSMRFSQILSTACEKQEIKTNICACAML